ncbi:MAG: S8 family serine peptidase [Pseudomonadota bacterium]
MARRRLARRFAGIALPAAAALLLGAGAAPAGGTAGVDEVELIVGFRAGVPALRQEQAVRSVGGTSERRYARIAARLVRVRGAGARRALERDPSVRYVEENRRVSLDAVPNDPQFGSLWGLHNTGQAVGYFPGTPDADIDAPEAWDVSTGAGVTVAVVDTGVDLSHPDLAANAWTNQREVPGNRVDDDGNGYVDDVHGWDFYEDDATPQDGHGHGTHVAGTVAAVADNGVGVAGVAPRARLMALRMMGPDGVGSTADAVEALLYAAANGAVVANASFGDTEDSQALRDAVAVADADGMLVVAAAGNDGSDNDVDPRYPAAIDAPNLVAVAATDNGDDLAWFSNVGAASVDLGAPGASILSTWPGGRYQWLDGTSMAAPHVSGAAALAKAAFPAATAVGLKALLLRTVDPLTSLAGQTATGGRLNANAAVRCADAPQVWVDMPAAPLSLLQGQAVPLRVLAGRCGDPAGVTVSATANGVAAPLTPRGDGVYTGTVTPTAPGAFVISVSASAGGRTDTRTLTGVVDATVDAVVGGAPVTVTASAPGQNIHVRFAGTAGHVVAIRASSVSISTSVLSVTAPDGATVFPPAYVFASGSFLEPRTLPATGDYMLLVDPQGAATGSMTLTLYDVPPDQVVAATVGGPSVTLANVAPGQNARAQFAGVAGRTLSVRLTSTYQGAKVSLLAPDGKAVGPLTYLYAKSFVEPVVLPSSGTYTLLVDAPGAATGSATATLYDVPADATATTAPNGTAATVTTTVPGQGAKVLFDGTASTRVSVKVSSVTMSGARVWLQAPDGSTLVQPLYVGTAGGLLEPLTLPATGRYTVAVDPATDATGSVTLTVYLVPPDATASATVGGASVRVTTTAPGQNARVRVSGTAGTVLAIRASDVTMQSATLRLVAPDGSVLVPTTYVFTSGTFVEPRTLPLTGDYELLVDPQSAAVGSLTLTFLDVPPDATATAVVGGGPVTLAVTVPGQGARVTFAADAGRTVTVSLTGVTVQSSKAWVLAPGGATVVQPTYLFTSPKSFTFTAAATGVHTLVLDPQAAAVGSYTVAVT